MSENSPLTTYQSVRYLDKIVQIETCNLHGIECLRLDDVRLRFPKVTCLYIDDKQQSFLHDENGHRLEPLRIKACIDEVMEAFEPEENHSQCLQIEHIQEMQRALVLMNNSTQEKIKQAMTLMYELNEYTTPQYFYVLPVKNNNQSMLSSITNYFQLEYKLYFLCDCSDDPNERHPAPHDGYVIKEPTKFIADYGIHIRRTLNIIKTALPIVGRIVDMHVHNAPALISDAARSLDTFTLVTKINEAANLLNQVEETSVTPNTSSELKTMSNCLPLHGAPLRELVNYLEGVDNKNTLGNLYKKVTDDGHVRWVCLEHYDTDYHKQRMCQYAQQLKNFGGTFDENTKEVRITSDNQTPLEVLKLINLLKNGLKIPKLMIEKCCIKEADLNQLLDVCINQSAIHLVFTDVQVLNRFTSNYICNSISISVREDSLEVYLPNRYTNGDMKTVIQVLSQNKNRRIIKVRGIDGSFDYENDFTEKLEKKSTILIADHLNNIEILNELFSAAVSFTHVKLNYCYGSVRNFIRLCELLSKHETLIELDLVNPTGFDDEHVLGKLCKSFSNHKALKTLNLCISNIYIVEKNCKERNLIDLITKNPFVKRLLLFDSIVTADFAKAIIDKVNNSGSLKSLELYNCQIDEQIRSRLEELWIANKLNLIFESRQYYCAVAEKIREVLDQGKVFDQEEDLDVIDDHLNFNGKELGDKDLIILSKNSNRVKQCKRISLSNNQITSFGIVLLTEILFDHPFLEQLDLSSNNLCDGGVYLLTKILSINHKTKLQSICLKSNGITDEGIKYLGQMLNTNKTVRHLDLSNNFITNNGVQTLTQIIGDKKTDFNHPRGARVCQSIKNNEKQHYLKSKT
ncbi:unnamed protein product [Adineta ricciae]|uniref:Uncharacterized protein n=1 Tax=Adineta ricciae TaxID=249248 RepID=A0A814WUY9_ADIRI|nr:unnamed protein product [Adineta ricciae]